MVAAYRWDYVRAFFAHENLERLVRAEPPANNRLDYYPAVLLLGSFPWIPLVGVTLVRVRRQLAAGGVATYLGCWFATSFVFFTLAQSKLPTYILFLFVPLALYGGATLDAPLRAGFPGPIQPPPPPRGPAVPAPAPRAAVPLPAPPAVAPAPLASA